MEHGGSSSPFFHCAADGDGGSDASAKAPAVSWRCLGKELRVWKE